MRSIYPWELPCALPFTHKHHAKIRRKSPWEPQWRSGIYTYISSVLLGPEHLGISKRGLGRRYIPCGKKGSLCLPLYLLTLLRTIYEPNYAPFGQIFMTSGHLRQLFSSSLFSVTIYHGPGELQLVVGGVGSIETPLALQKLLCRFSIHSRFWISGYGCMVFSSVVDICPYRWPGAISVESTGFAFPSL